MDSGTGPPLLLRPLLAGLLAAGSAQTRFPKFDAYVQAYRAGRILYLDTGGGRQGGAILDSLGPDGRLARALSELVASDTPESARRLLALCGVSFDEDPEAEREQFAARQPWAVREKAAEALARLRSPPAIDLLAREVLLARLAYPIAARAASARALGESRFPQVVPPLRAAMRDPDEEVRAAAASALGAIGTPEAVRTLLGRARDEDPVVRARLLEALGRAGSIEAAKEGGEALEGEAVSVVVARLSDPDWRVRAAAADYLVLRPSRNAVEPLIAALAAEKERCATGAGRKRIVFSLARALTRLAGYAVSLDDPQRWQDWWAIHRDSFHVAPAVTASVGPRGGEPTYFGIPVRTDRVVFVLDVSGSMAEPVEVEPAPPLAGRPPRRARAGSRAPSVSRGPTKLQRAKEELLSILDRLGPDDRFNVVLFSGTVERVFDTVVPPKPENLAIATARVRGAAPAGGTNLFGALEAALRIRGVAVDRFYTDADTVFLLSDGAPTAGPVVDPDTLVGAISSANRGSRIALHGIYFGPLESPAAKFMERLSAENYGEFRRVAP
ncbi:MAG TPA: HEAT repeat domain-containing protein [Planctomycetota bacterium]|jgi:HEAT repeat protein|nr:HEAT repeat domain-containing protein [Planctomycetota bacterium]